jgi:hypothetical protein
MWLRRILLPTAALCSLVAFAMCRDRLDRIGGRWAIGHVQSLPEAGGGQRRLYRLTLLGRVRVDDLVQDARFYAPDCVIYSTRRRAASNIYFAACGNRIPVAVSWTGYTLEADGLQRVDSTWLQSGSIRIRRRLIPIATIRTAAARQPRFRRDWTNDPEHARDAGLSALESQQIARPQ